MSVNIKPKGRQCVEVVCGFAFNVWRSACGYIQSHWQIAFFSPSAANSHYINLTISTYLETYTHFSSAQGLSGPLRAD